MNKRKLLIINSNYPSESNLYGDVFVHSRLRHYLEHFDIQVLGCVPELNADESFMYEGIKVHNTKNKQVFVDLVSSFDPDVIGIHFVAGWMVDRLIRQSTKPIFIWIHGHEALGWYRRLFNIKLKESAGFVKYILSNIRQMYRMHNLVKLSNKTGKIKFIFVSNWMKDIMESDTVSRISNYIIIPNPVDTNQFFYRKKFAEDRFKMLLIRSFNSKKYANDIAINALVLLKEQHRDYFSKLEVAIYGKGYLFDKLVQPLRQSSNIKLFNHFVENKNIPLIHQNYGVFLCPTRQDAQGVSMCEAMSSGLVPLSSNNTAIPEFLKHNEEGLLSSDYKELAKSIMFLIDHPQEYLRFSKNASDGITAISGHEYVINKELTLLINACN